YAQSWVAGRLTQRLFQFARGRSGAQLIDQPLDGFAASYGKADATQQPDRKSQQGARLGDEGRHTRRAEPAGGTPTPFQDAFDNPDERARCDRYNQPELGPSTHPGEHGPLHPADRDDDQPEYSGEQGPPKFQPAGELGHGARQEDVRAAAVVPAPRI